MRAFPAPVAPGSLSRRAALACVVSSLLPFGRAEAHEQPTAERTSERQPLDQQPSSEGRPSFRIDALLLPAGLEDPRFVDRELRKLLLKEAKRQDWGAGRLNQIEARFQLRQLTLEQGDGALVVRATLVGRLPGGRAAESTISFGGAPHQKLALLRQVLRIVATGVITRLADLERKRRGL